MAGLYIHIPFCASRCIYCGFYSSTMLDWRDRYVDALCHEMELRPSALPIDTIYLGGGTPSQLSNAQLLRLYHNIYKRYQVSPTAEITMECNPDDVSEALLAGLPVNRISMGAQTFDDQRLNFLHRRHTGGDVRRAVALCRHLGIENISIDLMFGFPGETLPQWEEDIQQALDLKVEHLSAYSLMYEEGTPLYRMRQQGKVQEISDELSLRMYETLIDRLSAAGYEHYEISNFARPGFRSRHNSSYWHDVPYIGLGAAAHSYDLKRRQWNVSDVKAYVEAIERNEVPCGYEEIDEDTHYDDLVTTALRTKEGLALDALTPRHRTYLLQQARPHIEAGLLRLHDNRLSLTRRGIYLSDGIMSDLMYV